MAILDFAKGGKVFKSRCVMALVDVILGLEFCKVVVNWDAFIRIFWRSGWTRVVLGGGGSPWPCSRNPVVAPPPSLSSSPALGASTSFPSGSAEPGSRASTRVPAISFFSWRVWFRSTQNNPSRSHPHVFRICVLATYQRIRLEVGCSCYRWDEGAHGWRTVERGRLCVGNDQFLFSIAM